MEKAYDFKDLANRAKALGMEITEEAAGGLVDVVFSWFEESAKLSKTPIDDMAVGFLAPVRAFLATKIDKIDGKVN